MLIPLVALLFSVRSFQQQFQINFFADYTKRYQEIILNLPININHADFRIDSLEPDENEKTLRYMRAYFDLCSEEYFLWRDGKISEDVWEEWEKGIKFSFEKPAFKQAWQILESDTIYKGNFTDFVDRSILIKEA